MVSYFCSLKFTSHIEAEQELESMGEVQESDVDIGSLEAAKEKFREHEQYMQSLTQSQDNVGRVLHRYARSF